MLTIVLLVQSKVTPVSTGVILFNVVMDALFIITLLKLLNGLSG